MDKIRKAESEGIEMDECEHDWTECKTLDGMYRECSKCCKEELEKLPECEDSMTHSPEWAKVKADELARVDFLDDDNGPGEWRCPICFERQPGVWKAGVLQPFKKPFVHKDCIEEALLSAHAEGRKEGMEEAAKIAENNLFTKELVGNASKNPKYSSGYFGSIIAQAIRSATKREVGG